MPQATPTLRERAEATVRARAFRIVTSHTRSLIYRALKIDPVEGWKGSRKGVKMEIHISTHGAHKTQSVLWRARIAKQWRGGRSANIREAIEEIETQAALPDPSLFPEAADA